MDLMGRDPSHPPGSLSRGSSLASSNLLSIQAKEERRRGLHVVGLTSRPVARRRPGQYRTMRYDTMTWPIVAYAELY